MSEPSKPLESGLPDPVCGDCVSFTPEGVGTVGEIVGRCKFRPELGIIAQSLAYCHVLQLRKSRIGHVRVPPPTRARPSRSSARPKPITPDRHRASLAEPVLGDTEGDIAVDRDGLKQVLRELLEEETLYGYAELGNRWRGGTLLLKPADAEQQSKELPIETFFHKIVMLRDRLRVLEAKINGNSGLGDDDKVELQQYVSKIYGTLTTFNTLFRDKSDHFRSKS